MKRKIIGACLLIIVLAFPFILSNRDANTTSHSNTTELSDTTDRVKYKLDELGLSVSLPSDYIVFTRDTSETDPNLSAYGYTKESLSSIMTSNNIYLYAWDDYIDYKIYINMEDSSLEDFNLYSDKELSAMAESIVSGGGSSYIKSEIYQHDQTKFLKIYMLSPYEDYRTYDIKYYTVYDGRAISITFCSFSHINPSVEATFQSIVDSVVFDKAPKTKLSLSSILLSMLITIVIYSLPIIIYRYAVRKEPVDRRKAEEITIIYGLVAIIVMAVLILVADVSLAPGGAILLWSFVNYRMLVSGKKKPAEAEPSDARVVVYKEVPSAPQASIVRKEETKAPIVPVPIVHIEEHETPPEPVPVSTGVCSTIKQDASTSEIQPEQSVASNVAASPVKSEIKFCHKCGARLESDSIFCSQCGARIFFNGER